MLEMREKRSKEGNQVRQINNAKFQLTALDATCGLHRRPVMTK